MFVGICGTYTLVFAPTSQILYGDATGDGIVDGKDLVRLKKYLAAYDWETGTSDVVLGPEKPSEPSDPGDKNEDGDGWTDFVPC